MRTASTTGTARISNWPKNKIEPAFPAERDHMPEEVAINMLTAPKAKLTNRQRKNCMDARLKVYTSERPIVVTEDGLARLLADCAANEIMDKKAARKCGTKNIVQLRNLACRSVVRRARLQRQFEKLQAEEPPEYPGASEKQTAVWHAAWARRKAQAMALLSMAAEHIDRLRDAAESEIKRRLTPNPNWVPAEH